MTEDIEDMDPAELLEQAAEAKEAGDNETAAKMFNAVGNIYMSVAEFEEAHKCFSDSLELYKELKDETGVCDTMYNLGVAQINLERWDEAIST
ncbi:MAG: tetratricopeptide repeat protein, partial [Candidatus Thorarchaeota archaeon]